MKKLIVALICLMTMVTSVNAHNTHYPTYTEDGITYIKTGGNVSTPNGLFDTWDVLKVDKPYDKTITIPAYITINGEQVKIKGLREGVFSTCSSLDSLIISDGVSIDGNDVFSRCNNLTYLFFSHRNYRSTQYHYTYNGLYCKTLETTTGTFDDAFWIQISNSLEKLIIRDVEKIYTRMDFCKKLKTIVCYATNPPFSRAAAQDNHFGCTVYFDSDQWGKITLYVPRESLEKYYFDEVWGEIDNIYAIDEMPTEIESNNDTEVTASINTIDNKTITDNIWYSLNGIKVGKPTNGIYIKNGKKYIVK